MSARKPNASVEARPNESIERTLRRFRRACEKAGVKRDARRKRHYEKPSDARRRDARRRLRNQRRAERKTQRKERRRWARVKETQRVLGSAFAQMTHTPRAPKVETPQTTRRAS